MIGLLRDKVAEDPRQGHRSEEDTLHPPLEQEVSGLRLGCQVKIDGFVHLPPPPPPPIPDNIKYLIYILLEERRQSDWTPLQSCLTFYLPLSSDPTPAPPLINNSNTANLIDTSLESEEWR